MTKSYKDSGVDTAGADEWVDKISDRFGAASKNLISSFDSYSAVYKTSGDHCVALSCDGVGTKVLWTKAGLGSGAQVAQDLMAMNVNDLICVGATPQLFMDYLAIGSLRHQKESGFLSEFLEGLHRACEETGVLLVGGETAEMPGVYEEHQYDVAGFAVGFLTEDQYLDPAKIKAGDVVYGFRSSGPHSNGFSWLRKLFDPSEDAAFIREHLMPPTRLYVKPFLNLQQKLSGAICGAFHITGSGFLNLLRFNNPKTGISIGFDLDKLFAAPEWCVEVQKRSGASSKEMYQSFNMGLGFAFCVSPEVARAHHESILALGALEIGKVIAEPVVKVAGLTLSE
jgi:phosphoribosylformylglycinamidine cyclo-ligase